MVRAQRIGAKVKLDKALAEIAQLKAALADPGRAADRIEAESPNGIKTLGQDESPAKVTGGMTRRQQEEACFGKKTWVKVTEVLLPQSKDIQAVASYCRRGKYERVFMAKTEVLLPESEIQKLENQTVTVTRRRANIGAREMSEVAAQALNNGEELKKDEFGNYWFESVTPRFFVQRLRPEQESIVIS